MFFEELLADGKVEFDFMGKDCVRYQRVVPVTAQVWKNLSSFVAKRKPGDPLFSEMTVGFMNRGRKGKKKKKEE